MWPFSDNKKLDQVISQVTTLTQLILLGTEVKETAVQVKKLRDEVAALKAQLPGMSEEEISTRLEAIVGLVTGAAESLDLLQDKLPKPEEPA